MGEKKKRYFYVSQNKRPKRRHRSYTDRTQPIFTYIPTGLFALRKRHTGYSYGDTDSDCRFLPGQHRLSSGTHWKQKHKSVKGFNTFSFYMALSCLSASSDNPYWFQTASCTARQRVSCSKLYFGIVSPVYRPSSVYTDIMGNWHAESGFIDTIPSLQTAKIPLNQSVICPQKTYIHSVQRDFLIRRPSGWNSLYS